MIGLANHKVTTPLSMNRACFNLAMLLFTLALTATSAQTIVSDQLEFVPQRGHSTDIIELVFSPDSKTLASTQRDGIIVLWDVKTRKEFKRFGERALSSSYESERMQFSADGKLLVRSTALSNDYIEGYGIGTSVYEVKTGKLFKRLTGRFVGFTPEKNLLTVGRDSINVISGVTWKILKRASFDYDFSGNNYCITPGGKFLVFHPLGDTDRLLFWDVSKNVLHGSLTLPESVSSIKAVSADGKFVTIHSSLGQGTHIVDVLTKSIVTTVPATQSNQYFGTDSNQLNGYSFYENGEGFGHLVTYDIKTKSVVKDIENNAHKNDEVELLPFLSYDQANAFSLSRDGRYFVFPVKMYKHHGIEYGILLFNAENGTYLDLFKGEDMGFSDAGVSADEKYLGTTGGNYSLLFDLEDGSVDLMPLKPSFQFLRIHERLKTKAKFAKKFKGLIAVSPDSAMVLVKQRDSVQFIEVASGQVKFKYPNWDAKSERLRTPGVTISQFSKDNRLLWQVSKEEVVCWEIKTGLVLYAKPWPANNGKAHEHHFNVLVNNNIVTKNEETTYNDKFLQFWDPVTGTPKGKMFVVDSANCILLTSDNYYTASKGAMEAIVFRYKDQIFLYDQFDVRLNRPDIVLKQLGKASDATVKAYQRAYQKRLAKLKISESTFAKDFHLPVLQILSRNVPISTTEKSLQLKIKASDEKYFLDRVNVSVNDVPIFGSAGIPLRDKNVKMWEQDVNIELQKGKNLIKVSVMNEQGTESVSDMVKIVYEGEVVSNLYIIGIGVSKYSQSEYDLTYAAKDALDIAGALKGHGTRQVFVKTLIDKDAVRSNILQCKEFLSQTKVDDAVVVFFAGHGLLDDNLDYYLATSDVDFANPAANGLAYDDFESLLDGIAARNKLLLIDACHSGEVDKEESVLVASNETVENGVKSRGFRKVENKNGLGLESSFELMQQLFANLQRGSGAVVISSASGKEFAYESSEWNNGLFTYAIIDGLKNSKADLNKDSKIRVNEIRTYVEKTVKAMSGGKQTPTSRGGANTNFLVRE